ncbi:DUF2614 family zinc ribbon-containing protein [Ferroplasma acidiphilum]|uniref:Uncharacterized protein n=1 Tax=Ferroplasma acidiphilum TaxID=74969 RepID=A0A7K4FR06_9ARCH|nr:DUF2614 family zinc ribbon-containing protein [Ferroplasma acidiphilum]NOL60547.1 hypothetical protein [Ferroplasma acidiphilum]
MVKFHAINRVMTVGTFLFFASLIVLAVGAIFHSNSKILVNAFLYGGLAFLISIILLVIGVVIGARSGKLQQRTGDIFGKKKKKE